jgi:hypothetical protein
MAKVIQIFGVVDGAPGLVSRDDIRAWLDQQPEETTTTDPPPPPPDKEPDKPVPVDPPVVAPPVVTPKPQPSVAQLEHLFVGTQKTTGSPMFLIIFSDGKTRLIEDHSEGRFEKFSVCGGEIAIDLLPNVDLSGIPWTEGWGFNTPPDFVCPDDYKEGYFLDEKGKPERKFFAWKHYQEPEQSTETKTPLHLTIVADYEPKGNS